ncbi:MAG TPA: hypothetical protein VES95_11790 [Dermatophilaceae bacterium]|nr:hypothetical protein [Dermatophilaceae bacterium]
MSWLGVWLVGVGLADLLRAVDDPRARRAAPVVGAVGVLALGVLSGLTGVADLLVLALSTLPLLGWVALSGRALRTGRGHLAALGALAAGPVLLLALSGWAGSVGGALGRWVGWADLPLVSGHALDRVLLVLGLGLVNLATANVAVRLVLVGVGALRPTVADLGAAPVGEQPADRLRGGRLLGPLERLVILGLGLAGQLTAASIVVAAKGLIRWPELQARRDADTTVNGAGIDEVTEYFLVGSFVSWLLALASLALTR